MDEEDIGNMNMRTHIVGKEHRSWREPDGAKKMPLCDNGASLEDPQII